MDDVYEQHNFNDFCDEKLDEIEQSNDRVIFDDFSIGDLDIIMHKLNDNNNSSNAKISASNLENNSSMIGNDSMSVDRSNNNVICLGQFPFKSVRTSATNLIKSKSENVNKKRRETSVGCLPKNLIEQISNNMSNDEEKAELISDERLYETSKGDILSKQVRKLVVSKKDFQTWE